jgi:histidinol phosphatase-like enzyme
MLLESSVKHGIDPSRSHLTVDRRRDVGAGKAVDFNFPLETK